MDGYLPVQIAALLLLLVLSGFFSGSETGLMSLNRYRLRHLVKDGHRGAQAAARLLERPDRLIGVILLGNNFINILATTIATVVAISLFGQERGLLAASIGMTAVVLIFGEVMPKTVAAHYPERIAFLVSRPLSVLLTLLYPFVVAVNFIGNGLLAMAGIRSETKRSDALSFEELRTVIVEGGRMIPSQHRAMLLSILDLDEATVQDIMIPRSEMVGIDLAEPWEQVVATLATSRYTRLPVWREDPNNVIGVLHLRTILRELLNGELDAQVLEAAVRKPYFIPESVSLTRQMLEFQKRQRRMALVVDEYGDVRGLVTLDDLMEEIVGEFSTESRTADRMIRAEADGSYLVGGRLPIRTLNRKLNLALPTVDASTLGGLVVEALQNAPEPGATVAISDCRLTIESVDGAVIRSVRIQLPAQSSRSL